ncbi:MAG: hypothetical protein GC151_04245 [Betaproteobacteria bacterium]|nr:hypothetical protein [Betaproteobacteria bacterium]
MSLAGRRARDRSLAGVRLVAVSVVLVSAPGTGAFRDVIPAAYAEGSDALQQEHAKRLENCHWSDAMGKYLYECVRRHDGMNAQWCHEEALAAFCSADSRAPKATGRSPGR